MTTLHWERDERHYGLWTAMDLTDVLLWDVFLWRQPHEAHALLVAWADQAGQRGFVTC